MAKETARQRLVEGGEPVVAVLEGEKAARLKAKTMLLPSPLQMRDAIAAIPRGHSKTVRELRGELAKEAGADITCPAAANKYWRLVADAAEEDRAEGATVVTPWWRLTKDNEPNRWLPGGAERHRALLLEEGVQI